GFAGDLFGQALVVLGANIKIFRRGQRYGHLAHSALPRAIAARRRLGLSVTDGNASLEEVGHAERIAKRLRDLLEFEDFLRVRFLVDAMQADDSAALEVVRHRFVRCEHEFFDDAVRDVPLAAHDADHAALLVEFNERLGQIEIDRASSLPALIQYQREIAHPPEVSGLVLVAKARLGITFDDLVDAGVRHSFGRADYARHELRAGNLPFCVNFHHDAHH